MDECGSKQFIWVMRAPITWKWPTHLRLMFLEAEKVLTAQCWSPVSQIKGKCLWVNPGSKICLQNFQISLKNSISILDMTVMNSQAWSKYHRMICPHRELKTSARKDNSFLPQPQPSVYSANTGVSLGETTALISNGMKVFILI